MQELLQMKNCLLCGSGIEKRYHTERMVIPYQCPVCGRVTLAEDAAMALHYGSIESKHLLSGFTRERTELGLNPIDITARDIEEIGKSTNVPRNVSEKLDRLMQYLERKSEYPGKYVGLVSQRDYPIAYARNFEELEYLLRQLASLGWVEISRAMYGVVDGFRNDGILVTVDGWNHLVEIHRYQRVSDQAFVAMWFTPETESAFENGIAKAIRESGFNPLRVDKLEHNNIICDVIIAEIRKSAFVVADFTGHRAGVYFEAGFGLGLGIQVIWLCRKDYVEGLHFDTQQYNHIVWENETDLYQKLLNRIGSTIIR